MRHIELFHSLRVYEGAGFFGLLIEPTSDISACCLDDRLYFWKMPVFLHKMGKIVDIVEEGHPDIVGRVVALQL